MRRKIAKVIAPMMSAVLGVSLLCGTGLTSFAFTEQSGFQVEDHGSGLAVEGITDAAVVNGVVTIPDTLNGKNVTFLGNADMAKTFLGKLSVVEKGEGSNKQEIKSIEVNDNVNKLVIGKNVAGVSRYSLYGTTNLSEIEVDEANNTFQMLNDQSLTGNIANGKALIKQLQGTDEDIKLDDAIKTIHSMDHLNFGTLDLNNASKMLLYSLTGSTIDTLIIRQPITLMDGNGNDILLGADVGAFETDPASGYNTDGQMLSKGNRIIKFTTDASVSDQGYFDGFTSISPYAFTSIAQYQEMSPYLPESLTKNVVFSFFNQDMGAFIVNGEIGFCYDFGAQVPTSVGSSKEYSASVDAKKYDQIRALMYIGVPYDATGLFEDTFGVPYEEYRQNAETKLYGDVGLNAVSAAVYKVLDNVTPQNIRGTRDGFELEKVYEYMDKLVEAAMHQYQQYNYNPSFGLNGADITFERQADGSYLSNEVSVNAVNGNGEVDNDYQYTIHINTAGVTTENGETSFQTGETVRFVSAAKPDGVAFSYDKPSLKFYDSGSNKIQNVLVSATSKENVELNTDVNVHSVLISKVDATTSKELPGAKLTLSKDGVVKYEWVSTDTPYEIKDMEDGEWTLTEVMAPDGYQIAESIKFTVVAGKVSGGKVVMKDSPDQTVAISKIDATTSKELPGAKLTLTKDGVVKYEWVSSDTPYIITNMEDGQWTLKEVTAPNGYEVAEEITFTVKDGQVSGGVVVMKDQPKVSTPSEPDENTPSQPDKPHVDGGYGGGGGGGGSDKPTVTPQKDKTPTPPTPVDNGKGTGDSSYTPDQTPHKTLPKTGEAAVGLIAAVAALGSLAYVYRKKLFA